MARLPDETALGQVGVASSGRPIATFDTTGYARGAAAMAEGAVALGKGLETAATNVDAVARQQKAQDDALEVARAKSDFLTGKVKLDSTLDNETDHETLPGRYTASLEDIKQKAAARISDPRKRELFSLSVADDVARGNALADKKANTLWQDATVADTTNRLKDIQDSALKSTDPEERKRLIETGNDLITTLANKGVYSEADAIRAKQTWAQQYATAFYASRADSEPEAVVNEFRTKPGSDADLTNRILGNEGKGKNPRSSAMGAGQFLESKPGGDQTWVNLLTKYRPDLVKDRSLDEINALRADDKLARDMTDKLRQENIGTLKNLGIAGPTPGQQYLAHVVGPASAAALAKADPNMPAIDVLTQAVGAKKAKEMVDANPSILSGKLAGSVTQWADGKMGGATPGGGGLVDMLRPDVREQILARAQDNLHKRNADDLSEFKARIDDSQAEAARTGSATNPLSQGDFIGRLGAVAGPKAYAQYKAGLDLSRDVARVSSLDPEEQDRLLKSYEPRPGAGYADQTKRQDLLAKAIDQERRLRAKDPEFKQRIDDSVAEAGRTGTASNPVPLAEFQRRLGKDDGGRAFTQYQAALRLGRDVRNAGDLSPQEQAAVIGGYDPQLQQLMYGTDYTDAAKRQDVLVKAIGQVRAERDKDPAAFAISRLPVVREAYGTLEKTLNDPTVPLAAKQAAARDYTTKTDMEQARIGVPPEDRRIVPGWYVDQLNARLDNPKAAGGTANVAATLANEAAVWGDQWPQVARQMSKSAAPVVTVIGSGIKPAAAQILSEFAHTKLGDIANDQSEEKLSTIRKDVRDAFRPLARSMLGNEGTQPLVDAFQAAGEKLSAYYVRNGKSSADAALQAFDELAGHKYDFSGRTYRVPLDIPFTPATIADGVAGAKANVGALGIAPRRSRTGLSANYSKEVTPRAYARDGIWVTAPDESGLGLVYEDEVVRRGDGKPLVLSWQQLAEMGKAYRGDTVRKNLEAFPTP